jgi:hypothetical protein
MNPIAMPNESGTIAMAAAMTMWSLAFLAFLGVTIWLRAHPGRRNHHLPRHLPRRR